MQRRLVLVVFGCFMAIGSSAAAQNLKERKEIDRGQKELDEKLAEVNKTCGTKLKVTVNVKSFVGKIDSSHNFASPHGWCGQILGGVGIICGDADGKKAVLEKLGQVKCHFDAKATSEKLKRYGPIFSLKKKTLSAGYNFETADIEEATKKFLENSL